MGMEVAGVFGGGLRGFWGGLVENFDNERLSMGMGCWGRWRRIWGFWGGVLGIRAQNRTPGGPWAGRILRSPPAQGEAASPAVRPPRPFFGPTRGGAGPRWDRVFFSMQTGRSGFNRRDSKDQDDCFLGYLYV